MFKERGKNPITKVNNNNNRTYSEIESLMKLTLNCRLGILHNYSITLVQDSDFCNCVFLFNYFDGAQ